MPETPSDSNEDQVEEKNSTEEGSDEGKLTKEDEPYSQFSDMGEFGRSKKLFERFKNINSFMWSSWKK